MERSAAPVGRTAAREPIGCEPGEPLGARLRVPGSKSLALRIALAAALARGRTRIAAWPDGADAADALALLERAGVPVERADTDAVTIEGRPFDRAERAWAAGLDVDVGESGTLARLATALLAVAPPAARRTVRARGTLLARESPALFAALEAAGASFEHAGRARGWPVVTTSAPAPAVLTLERAISSQEASALAFAAAASRGARVHVVGPLPSAPYFEMSLAVLERFGARVARSASGDRREYAFTGALTAPDAPVTIEPDASAAAVALVAACISGGELAVPDLGPDSLQGDVRIAEHLAAFGCVARWEHGALVAGGRPTRRVDLDLSGEPDLAPPLAALAAARALVAPAGEGPSVLTGLAALAHKESARVAVLAAHLRRMGFDVDDGPEHLAIARGSAERAREAALELDAANDHRIAFFLALLGLARPGVRIRGADAVAKSWPRFFDDLAALGATVVRR